MREVIIWILVFAVLILGVSLGLQMHRNQKLNLEIEGWSDRVMILERMIEPEGR